MGIGKRFPMPYKGHSIQLRAEAFNVTNSVRFNADPWETLSFTFPGSFGNYSQMMIPARVIQVRFALRVLSGADAGLKPTTRAARGGEKGGVPRPASGPTAFTAVVVTDPGYPAAPLDKTIWLRSRRSTTSRGQDNVQFLGLDIHNPVFVVSSLTIIAFVAGVLTFQAEATAAFGALRAGLMSTFDWVFMGAGNLFVLFCLLLMVTPPGRVRLGGADARPDYSRSAWFAMLFAAGMGIGLMFFGVSEPVEHFLQPPLGLEASDTAAVRLGMASAIYHWGIHGWAVYAVVALSIAFASYNLGLPMTLRSAFYPLMGNAVGGRFGHGIDILAVFATLFGLATSLGLGAKQVAAGLAHLWGTSATDTTQVLLIVGITGVALASVVSGMEKGVKRLSEANLLLALLLLVFMLTVGPTRDIATGVVTSLGQYLAAIGPLSNWVGRKDLHFMHGWTTFFWAWWIAWSPFVGLFIARISRGRTVRELIACMLIIPDADCRDLDERLRRDRGVAVRRPRPSRP